MIGSADMSEVRVVDERSFKCPYRVEMVRKTGAKTERCLLKSRQTNAPSQIRTGGYLGHGTFGAVFEVANSALAIKVEKKTKISFLRWEAAMAAKCHLHAHRTPDDDEDGDGGPRCRHVGRVVEPASLYLWADGAAMTMPREPATLADLVRVHTSSAEVRLPEAVALFYALGTLECVMACHGANVLHCDVKPDNFLVTFGRGVDIVFGSKKSVYQEAALWQFGLILIDFGRAIDLSMHVEAQRFATTASKTHVADYCWPPAARGATWRHEVDIYASGVMLHALVCGKAPTASGPTLPRGWKHKELWRCFPPKGEGLRDACRGRAGQGGGPSRPSLRAPPRPFDAGTSWSRCCCSGARRARARRRRCRTWRRSRNNAAKR
ncbi:kinase-like domain-containing protein [Pelagophyceae sp. CCMP2097]|nr:kinase-like domain-containing protein [Pelagophyceae sp. CCMP2097]